MNKIKNNIIDQFNLYIHKLPTEFEMINPNKLGDSIYRQYLMDLDRIVKKVKGLNAITYYRAIEDAETSVSADKIRDFFKNEMAIVNWLDTADENFIDYRKEFEKSMVKFFKLENNWNCCK